MTLYFTTWTVLVSLILTSTVMVLLWQGDKIIKAHTHSWQSTCTKTLMQRQNRLGLKDIIIGAQPPLNLRRSRWQELLPALARFLSYAILKHPGCRLHLGTHTDTGSIWRQCHSHFTEVVVVLRCLLCQPVKTFVYFPTTYSRVTWRESTTSVQMFQGGREVELTVTLNHL